MRLPVLSTSDVEFVTDEAVCTPALRTYVASVPPGHGSAVTSVWVVRVGTRYLVTEPTKPAGERLRAIVMDGSYVKISGIFGL